MNLEEKLEELQSFTLRYIKTIAMDLVVVLVAVSYVFYQMVTLEQTNLNPLVLIAQAIMGIICGVVIKQALGENGFSKGYNSKHWNEEEEKYNSACNVALPFMEKVDNFYEFEIIDKKRNYRRQHLQEVRLKYDMWFDRDGNYIATQEMYDKLDKKQKKVVNRCIKVRVYPLNLFSQYTISADTYTKKEQTDKTQRAKNIRSNTITATVIAVIGVYFIPQLNGWNWASFISATFQVAMWVLFGILQLYTNYNFVVQDLVSILRKKKEDIKRFVDGCNKHMYDHSPYDKVVEEIKDKEIEKEKEPIYKSGLKTGINLQPIDINNR